MNPVVPGAWLPKLKQKKAAAEEAVKTSEKEATKTSEKAHSAEKAAKEEAISDEEIGNVAEKEVSEEETKNINDNNKDSYECPICEFSSTWEKGLEVHMGRKHKNIEQIDRSTDVVEIDEKYDQSEKYWKTGRLGIAYYTLLAANSVLDASDMLEEEKLKE